MQQARKYLRIFRLKGMPISILGEATQLEGEFIVENHVRIFELMTANGSEFSWRTDSLFPGSLPIRLFQSSISYDREVTETDLNDKDIVRQYKELMFKQRAAASGLQMV